jgi:hypothetical protein
MVGDASIPGSGARVIYSTCAREIRGIQRMTNVFRIINSFFIRS